MEFPTKFPAFAMSTGQDRGGPGRRRRASPACGGALRLKPLAVCIELCLDRLELGGAAPGHGARRSADADRHEAARGVLAAAQDKIGRLAGATGKANALGCVTDNVRLAAARKDRNQEQRGANASIHVIHPIC